MSEITKNQIKLIRLLQQKKYRVENGLFIVEGVKNVNELLNVNFEIEKLYATSDWEENHNDKIIISQKELKQISTLSSPNKVLAIVKIPKNKTPKTTGLILALNNINDPGNLGTIIRTADWFGVSQIVCSNTSVDCYNPKVVQSTKGSIFKIDINYTNLTDYLAKIKVPIYGASLSGKNLSEETLTDGVLLMGSESHGISDELMKFVTNEISIPKFGNAESLNVAMATGIILHEFKR